MSSKDRTLQRARVYQGLLEAHYKMLTERAIHGDSVVYGDRKGLPQIVPASLALDQFMVRFPNVKSH